MPVTSLPCLGCGVELPPRELMEHIRTVHGLDSDVMRTMERLVEEEREIRHFRVELDTL